jgi:V/A-type H+-transporting ATPase subunit K
MNEIAQLVGWLGIYAPMALSAIGSTWGCAFAGQAAIGAMLETDVGHGRLVGVSAMPSSQVVYGIVVMFSLNRPVGVENGAALFAVGLLAGVALLISAIYQGRCCASAINAAKAKPEILGLALAPAAIVEGFAVFAFVFALVVIGGLPGSI